MRWHLQISGSYFGFAERTQRIARFAAIRRPRVRRTLTFRAAQMAFAALAFCLAATPAGPTASAANLAATVPPAASPSPSPTPFIPLQIPGTNHIVYVLATDVRPDYDSTRDKVLAGFSQIMQHRALKSHWQLIPMPEWTLDNFVYACNHIMDPTYTIEGAMILRVFGVSYWITHRTFQEAPTSAVDADAIYAACQPKGNPKVAYTWHDAVEYKDGTVGITNLSNLSLLLPMVALYQSFAPGKGQTTTTTKPFLQPSPLPPGTQVTTVTSSYNPQAAGNTATLATSLLASGLTYTQAVLNTPPPINDRATWNAVNKLSAQIAADTLCPPSASAPTVTFQDKAAPDAKLAPFCPAPSP
jgi:hypothetical protein